MAWTPWTLKIPGTDYSISPLLAEQVAQVGIGLAGLRAWFLPLQRAGEALLQGCDEVIGSERSASASVSAQQFVELLVFGLADEHLPIGDRLQERSYGDEGIAASSKVGRGTRPRPILLPSGELSKLSSELSPEFEDNGNDNSGHWSLDMACTP